MAAMDVAAWDCHLLIQDADVIDWSPSLDKAFNVNESLVPCFDLVSQIFNHELILRFLGLPVSYFDLLNAVKINDHLLKSVNLSCELSHVVIMLSRNDGFTFRLLIGVSLVVGLDEKC